MGEIFTYFESMDRLVDAMEVLYQTKLRPFLGLLSVPMSTRKHASMLLVDLKCEALLSRSTNRVLERTPLGVLKQKFRELEQYMVEAHQMYPDRGEPLSYKDRAAGEREEANV